MGEVLDMDSSPDVLASHEFWKSVRVTAPPDYFTAFRKNIQQSREEKKKSFGDGHDLKTETSKTGLYFKTRNVFLFLFYVHCPISFLYFVCITTRALGTVGFRAASSSYRRCFFSSYLSHQIGSAFPLSKP